HKDERLAHGELLPQNIMLDARMTLVACDLDSMDRSSSPVYLTDIYGGKRELRREVKDCNLLRGTVVRVLTQISQTSINKKQIEQFIKSWPFERMLNEGLENFAGALRELGQECKAASAAKKANPAAAVGVLMAIMGLLAFGLGQSIPGLQCATFGLLGLLPFTFGAHEKVIFNCLTELLSPQAQDRLRDLKEGEYITHYTQGTYTFPLYKPAIRADVCRERLKGFEAELAELKAVDNPLKFNMNGQEQLVYHVINENAGIKKLAPEGPTKPVLELLNSPDASRIWIGSEQNTPDLSEKGFDASVIDAEVIRLGMAKAKGENMRELSAHQLKARAASFPKNNPRKGRKPNNFWQKGIEGLLKLRVMDHLMMDELELAVLLVAGSVLAAPSEIKELLRLRGVYYIRAPTGWSIGSCIIRIEFNGRNKYLIILPSLKDNPNNRIAKIAHELRAVLFPITHQQNKVIEKLGIAISPNARRAIQHVLLTGEFGRLRDLRSVEPDSSLAADNQNKEIDIVPAFLRLLSDKDFRAGDKKRGYVEAGYLREIIGLCWRDKDGNFVLPASQRVFNKMPPLEKVLRELFEKFPEILEYLKVSGALLAIIGALAFGFGSSIPGLQCAAFGLGLWPFIQGAVSPVRLKDRASTEDGRPLSKAEEEILEELIRQDGDYTGFDPPFNAFVEQSRDIVVEGLARLEFAELVKMLMSAIVVNGSQELFAEFKKRTGRNILAFNIPFGISHYIVLNPRITPFMAFPEKDLDFSMGVYLKTLLQIFIHEAGAIYGLRHETNKRLERIFDIGSGLSRREVKKIKQAVSEEIAKVKAENRVGIPVDRAAGLCLCQTLCQRQTQDETEDQVLELKQLLLQLQILLDSDPCPPFASTGIEGLLIADEILRQCQAVGIVIGSTSCALWHRCLTQDSLKEHHDIDVAVLSDKFWLTKSFEGGIDWWLPVKTDLVSAGRIFINGNNVFLRAGVGLDDQSLPPGLYLPSRNFLIDLTICAVLAGIDSRVLFSEDSVDALRRKLERQLLKRVALLWLDNDALGPKKIMAEGSLTAYEFSNEEVVSLTSAGFVDVGDRGRYGFILGEGTEETLIKNSLVLALASALQISMKEAVSCFAGVPMCVIRGRPYLKFSVAVQKIRERGYSLEKIFMKRANGCFWDASLENSGTPAIEVAEKDSNVWIGAWKKKAAVTALVLGVAMVLSALGLGFAPAIPGLQCAAFGLGLWPFMLGVFGAQEDENKRKVYAYIREKMFVEQLSYVNTNELMQSTGIRDREYVEGLLRELEFEFRPGSDFHHYCYFSVLSVRLNEVLSQAAQAAEQQQNTQAEGIVLTPEELAAARSILKEVAGPCIYHSRTIDQIREQILSLSRKLPGITVYERNPKMWHFTDEAFAALRKLVSEAGNAREGAAAPAEVAATVLSEENTGFPLRPRFSVGFAMPDLRPATAEDAALRPVRISQEPSLRAPQGAPACRQAGINPSLEIASSPTAPRNDNCQTSSHETMNICRGIARQLRYYSNVREDMLCQRDQVSDLALAGEILRRIGCEYKLGRWVLSSGKNKQETVDGLNDIVDGKKTLDQEFSLGQETETQTPEKIRGAIYIYLKQALRTTIKFVNIDRLMNSGNIAEGQRDFVKEALSRMGLNENADENQALWYFPEDREKLRLDLEDVFAKRLQNFDAVFPVRAQEVIAAPGTVPLARQEIAMAGTVPVALEAPESEEEVRMRILNYVSDTFPRTRFYILDILESCQTENRALVEDTLRRLKIRPVGGAWFLWHGHNPCTIQNGINRVKQGELFDTVFPLLKEQAPVSVLPESRTVSTAFTVTAPDGKFELNANTVDWLADNLLRALQARQAGQPIEEVVIEGVEARSLSPSQANGWKGVLKSRFALEDSLRIGASISIRLPNSWRSYELNALREKLLENWAMKNKDCPGGLSAKVLAADFGLDRSKVEGILNQAYLGFSKSATDPDIYVKRQSVTTRPQAFPVKRSSVERARDDIVRQLDIPQGQGGRRTFYLSYYLSRYGLSPQEVEQLFAKETCTPGGKRFWFKKHVGDDGQVGFRAIKKESGTDLSASADETNKYPAAIRPLAQYEQFRPAELKVIFMYKKVKIDVLERGSLIQGQLKLLEERLGKAYVDSNQEVFEVAIRITPNTSIIEIPEAGVCRVVSEYDVKDREIRLYPLFIEIDELLAQVFNYPHYDSATLHFINSCLRDELGHARGLGQEVGDKNTLEGMDFWVLSCNIDVLSREDNKVIYALGSWLGRMKLCKGMQLFLDADYNKAVIELQAAIKEFTKLSESKIQELGKEAEIAALLVRAAETMNGNQLLRGSNVFECISTMPQWQKEHFQFLGTVLRTVLQLINRGIDPGDILKYGLAPLSVIAKTTDELKLCLETAERLALDLSSDVEEINRFIQFEIPLIAFDSRDPRQTESRLRMITEEQGQERVVLAAKQCWFDNFRRAFSHEYTDCEQEGPGGPDWQHGYLNNGLVEINAYKQFIGLFTRRIKQILDVSACDWNKALEQVSSEVVTIGNVFFGYAIDFEREQDGARIYYHWDQEQDISICPAFPRQSSLEVKHEDPGQGSNRPVKVDENDRIHIEAQADTIDRNYRETIKKVNADLPRCQRDELLLRLYKQNPYSRQEKFSSFWPRIYRRVFMPKKDPKAPQTDNSVYLAVTEAIDWLDEVGAVSTFARLRKLDELDAKYRLERYRILAQKAILEPGVGGVIQVAKKRFGEIAWNEDKNKEIKDHSEKGFDEKLINVEVIRFGKSEGNTMAPLHDAQLKKLEKVLKSDSLVISQRDREFLERGKEKLRKLEIASSGEERFEKAIELVAGRLPFADRLWIEELLQFRGVHFIRAPTGWSVGACIIETIISKQKYYYIILPENTKPGIIAHEIQAVLFPISHQENELLENEGFAALSDNAKERITKTLREVAFGDLLDPRAGYEQYLPEIMLGTLSVVTGIGLFYQFVLHPYLRHRRRKMREANSVNTVTSNSQKERDLALKAELRRIRAQFRLTRTDVEEIISAPYSHDRGKQLIENQISGKNLGEVVSLALSEMVQQGLLFNGKVPWIFSKSGRFTIEHMAKIEGDSLKRLWELRWMLGKFNIRPVEARVLKLVCRFVSTRAAKLTAALLLVKQGQIADKSSHTRAVSVSIPGADFSKYPHFVKNIENTVKSCLGEQRASLLSLDLMHDASSGSTMVYLFHSQDSDIGLDAQDKRIAEAVHNVRAFVLGDIKEFDEHVAEKKEAFLSRLYHALERTFNSIIVKAHSGRIDPFVDINLMKFSSQIQDPLLHKTDRHVKVGFFPIAGNPLNWGHILPPLMCLNTLNMDTIVLRVQGEIGYKKLLACERVSVQDRHFMVREAIKGMFPLVRYTDLCSEENNHDEGAESMHHFLEMNPDRRIHLFYLIGAENEQRMWTYMRQQYEFFQRFNFGANPSHKITFSVIQRGEYGANVTLEELQDISRKCQVESGSKELLDVALVKDPDIDLRVSSTYYRNTQDGAYVPNNVHEFAKLRGYYGHPPIDPMTGQPVTDSQEKYFRMRLEAIARKMALQTEAVINRVPGGMPFISIDGGSGSGKTTIAEEVGRYLEEKGYDSQIIPLDMFLKDRVWRMAIQKLVTGRKLNDKEMVLVGDLKDKIQARQPYLDEEAFFDHGRILSLLELLERFRRGEDGLNVSETVDYLNGATGLDMAIIPKGTLLDKQCWRLLILDLLNGLPLEQQEKQNLADFVLNIQRNQPLPQMPIIFKDERVGEMAKDKIDEALRFLNADNQSHGLIILNAYGQTTKMIGSRLFGLRRGTIIAFEGKYANREELAPCFDLRYRLHDDPDRTKARFEIRSRKQSPDDADMQLIFYGFSLVPSYQIYDKKTERLMHGFIDLGGEEWFLDDSAQGGIQKQAQCLIIAPMALTGLGAAAGIYLMACLNKRQILNSTLVSRAPPWAKKSLDVFLSPQRFFSYFKPAGNSAKNCNFMALIKDLTKELNKLYINRLRKFGLIGSVAIFILLTLFMYFAYLYIGGSTIEVVCLAGLPAFFPVVGDYRDRLEREKPVDNDLFITIFDYASRIYVKLIEIMEQKKSVMRLNRRLKKASAVEADIVRGKIRNSPAVKEKLAQELEELVRELKEEIDFIVTPQEPQVLPQKNTPLAYMPGFVNGIKESFDYFVGLVKKGNIATAFNWLRQSVLNRIIREQIGLARSRSERAKGYERFYYPIMALKKKIVMRWGFYPRQGHKYGHPEYEKAEPKLLWQGYEMKDHAVDGEITDEVEEMPAVKALAQEIIDAITKAEEDLFRK
ncbi:MAG: hypothetical protein KJ880_07400, partial [Candidatus Omnitrophica bacterium]|nr:hypothetical protein [Candidatus Omnitrophota bacterium]